MSIFTIKAITATPPPNSKESFIDKWSKDRAYYSGNDASGSSFMNYMKLGTPELQNVEKGNERVFGMFNESGILTEKSEKELKRELKNTQSHIWTGVINFEKAEGIKHCSTVNQAEEGFKKAFKEFCTEAQIDKKNIAYAASLHENSDLYHLHYIFYEKQPKRLSKIKEELAYSKKFVIDKNAIEKMPSIIDKAFGGLLQENTLKSERVKAIKRERIGKIDLTTDLKSISKEIQRENFMHRNIEYCDWYASLSNKARKSIDKLSVKIIKKQGVQEYFDVIKTIPKEKKKEFREKTYNDIGLNVIRAGMDVHVVEDDINDTIKRLTKEQETYKLTKPEQINYRMFKKAKKNRIQRVVDNLAGLDIKNILTNRQLEIKEETHSIKQTQSIQPAIRRKL